MDPKPVLAGSGYLKAKVQVLVRFCNIQSRGSEIEKIGFESGPWNCLFWKLELEPKPRLLSFENNFMFFECICIKAFQKCISKQVTSF